MIDDRIQSSIQQLCEAHLEHISYAFPEDYERFVTQLMQLAHEIFRDGIDAGIVIERGNRLMEQLDIDDDEPPADNAPAYPRRP